jgi:hypothetical protein
LAAPSESNSPVCGGDESAYVCDEGTGLGRFSFAGNAGLDRSFVMLLRRGLALLGRASGAGLRSRAGIAGFGMLVEVVNDGGAGNGPSIVLDATGSLSTALGG